MQATGMAGGLQFTAGEHTRRALRSAQNEFHIEK